MRGGTIRLLLVLGVSAVAGFAGCFTAPSADVQFSCDPEDAPACPPGYACEADGCCHRDGTDVQATFGDCKLEGGSGGFPTTDTDPGGSGSTGADTDDAASSSSTAGTTGTTGTTSGSTGSSGGGAESSSGSASSGE